MLGSYFAQSMYGGPFQSFTGAVDIIVVQQVDGTFKSSPWCVKFADFQNALRRREKFVHICVNDVPAEFSMLVDNKGEAYFEGEVDEAILALPPPPPSSSDAVAVKPGERVDGSADSLGKGPVEYDTSEDVEIIKPGHDASEYDASFRPSEDAPAHGARDETQDSASEYAGQSSEDDDVSRHSRSSKKSSAICSLPITSEETGEPLKGFVVMHSDSEVANIPSAMGNESVPLAEASHWEAGEGSPLVENLSTRLDDRYGEQKAPDTDLGISQSSETWDQVVLLDLNTAVMEEEPEMSEVSEAKPGNPIDIVDDTIPVIDVSAYPEDVSAYPEDDVSRHSRLSKKSSAICSLPITGEEKGEPPKGFMVMDSEVENDPLVMGNETVPLAEGSRWEAGGGSPFVENLTRLDDRYGEEKAPVTDLGNSQSSETRDQVVLLDLNTAAMEEEPEMSEVSEANPGNSIGIVDDTIPVIEVRAYPENDVSRNSRLSKKSSAICSLPITGEEIGEPPKGFVVMHSNSEVASDPFVMGNETVPLAEGSHWEAGEGNPLVENLSTRVDDRCGEQKAPGTDLGNSQSSETWDQVVLLDLNTVAMEEEPEMSEVSEAKPENPTGIVDDTIPVIDVSAYPVSIGGGTESQQPSGTDLHLMHENLHSVGDTNCALVAEDTASIKSETLIAEGREEDLSGLPDPLPKVDNAVMLLGKELEALETVDTHTQVSPNVEQLCSVAEIPVMDSRVQKSNDNLNINGVRDQIIVDAPDRRANSYRGGASINQDASRVPKKSASGSDLAQGSQTAGQGGGFTAMATGTKEGAAAQPGAVVPSPPWWSLWPRTLSKSRAENAPLSSNEALLAATKIAIQSPVTEELLRKNGYYKLVQKKRIRTYVPTSEQIASLRLKDGSNKVTFTFPRVLGKSQVDARIYLWKWNTRIVISDVDGTITKSDVLGQVMHLVGRDWSQYGVTRLFSAIKDNGYEVLFLSARAISQSYLTRQFLFNLKQDGATLPHGPVFISPDGLVSSLYREVIRRAPHEFKISCLQGIRELFPSDVNPFYAGFGNRDTDEISYLKVGIPRGKIFLINPKGEIVVNHHVDVKSYTSIHALVDDMFPPMSSHEQEDFNSWNYWKLPIPDITDELPSKVIVKSARSTTKGGGTIK